jgi:hypothetical protein
MLPVEDFIRLRIELGQMLSLSATLEIDGFPVDRYVHGMR